MPANKWLIVGISGVTNGGKSVLAQLLHSNIPNSKIIKQDDYFLPVDSPNHVFVAELNHNNWEILSSLDMKKFLHDILEILGPNCIAKTDLTTGEAYTSNTIESVIERLNTAKVQLLIIEGFSIFNFPPLDELCHLKYYLVLDKDTCRLRRDQRTYDPPDVPGYFQQIVWPEYQKYYNEIKQLKNIKVLNGLKPTKDHLSLILNDLSEIFIHN